MNLIHRNIRTLFVIMSVITLAWGNVNEVKGQDIYIFPSGVYSDDQDIMEMMQFIIPADFAPQIFQGTSALYDIAYTQLLLGEEFGFYAFEKVINLEHLPFTEGYKIAMGGNLAPGLTISSQGGLVNAAGKNLYYAAPSDAINMSYWGSPYFNTTTFSSSDVEELLTTTLLPEGYPFILFNGNNLQMDQLFIAANFNESEIALAQNVFANNSITANQSYMLPFSKVTCSDGVQFYLSTGAYPTKSTNFTLNNIHNKKIYFTGTVDEAYAGAGISSEGFIYLKGTDNEKVDIYLQDFIVNKVKDKNLGDYSLNHFLEGFVKGMACPFAIGTTGEWTNENSGSQDIFQVNFHIKGRNKLTGGASGRYTVTDNSVLGKVEQILGDLVQLSSAPIAIRPISDVISETENRSCKLSFDDRWLHFGTEIRTNGLLELPINGDRSAPSIDLGNKNGRCVFDGGQYKFTTAGSNSMFYVSSMAICYRMYTIQNGLITLNKYGVGSSVAVPEKNTGEHPTVLIKNGSFSTYSAKDIQSTIDVVGHGWYKDYTDLRFPIKTYINGGTFNNCQAYRCEASAEQGIAPINSLNEVLCQNKISVSIPDATTGLSSLDLSASHPYYGTSSLTPIQENGQYYVYPYLPGECNEATTYMNNWVTIIPQMGAEGLLTMGGDIEVRTDDGARENAYLFYTRLNRYTKENASVDFQFIKPTIEMALVMGGGYEYTKVTNTLDYQIKHGLYTMLSFNSNTWATICPPFDVHNIYVIETLPDEKLAEHGLTQADKGTEKFLKAQGKCDGVLAQGIVTSLCPDILSGKGSGVRMNLIDICRKTLGIEPYKLTHYNPNLPGHSSKEANYYLYEQKHDADELGIYSGAWTKANNLEDYADKWVYATPVEGNTYTDQDGNTFTAPILMKRDSVYSIFLPAGKDKYWDGKYLIFEGYGPQEMNGSQDAKNAKWDPFIMDFLEYSNDQFFLAGNSSFTNLHIETADDLVFFPDTDGKKHDYVRANVGDSILPWQAYMAMNQYNTETYATLSALSPSRNAVQAAPQSDELTNIPLVKDRSLIAYEQEGMMLCAYTKQQIAVYGVDGILVWKGEMKEGEQQHLSIPAGVYIIQGEQEAVKIVIRK